MKLQTVDREVTRSNVVTEGNFSINASAKAFKILSDGLYKDKIKAIVRELSCNAYDAHIAAGCPDKPFVIKLPNSLNPLFSVKDFGIGLSHDDVMHLSTTYFASTKSESNDFIGALGLGMKSPFSYAKSYTIISRFEGMKRTYSAFIAENGAPNIALMATVSTDEHPGLEIQFPVDRKDFETFYKKTKTTLSYFPVKPTLVGVPLEIDEVKYLHKRKGWGLRDEPVSQHYRYYSTNKASDKGAQAIQGTIAYPLSPDVFNNLTKGEKGVLESPMDIWFDIGELDVTASREELSYDQVTRDNIIKKIAKISDHVVHSLSSSITNASTYWDALIRFDKLFGDRTSVGTYFTEQASQSLTYKGRPLGMISITVEAFEGASFNYIPSSKFKLMRIPMEHLTKVVVTPKEHVLVVWVDGTVRTYRHRLQYHFNDNKDYDYILVIHTKSPDGFKKLHDMLGNPPYKTISEFEEPPKEIIDSYAPRKKLHKLYTYSGSRSYNKDVDWKPTDHDASTGGLYVALNNWEPQPPSYMFFSSYTMAQAAGIVIPTVFGIPGTFKNIPTTNSGWIEFNTFLKGGVKKLSKDSVVVKELGSLKLYREFKDEPFLKLVRQVEREGLTPKKVRSKFSALMNNWKLVADLNMYRAQAVESLLTQFQIEVRKTKPVADIAPLLEAAKLHYPLLENVLGSTRSSHHYSYLSATNVIHYVDAVD